MFYIFFFKQKTAYEMRISDWSSDVCSSDLRRVVWPDSKTGGMSKPMSEEAYRLLSTAPRQDDCPHVLPSPNHPGQHLTTGEYYNGWSRALQAAGSRSEERRVRKEWVIRVDIGGRRIIKKKNNHTNTIKISSSNLNNNTS